MSQHTERTPTPAKPRALLLVVPLAVCLLLGLADVALGMLRWPELGEPGPYLPALAATCALLLGGYALTWVLLIPVRRAMGLEPRALALSLGLFLVLGYSATAAELMRAGWLSPTRLFLPLGLAGAAAFISYPFATWAVGRASVASGAVRVLFALPLVALEILVLVWIAQTRPTGGPIIVATVLLVFLFVVALTLRAVWRFGLGPLAPAVLGVLMLAVFAAGVASARPLLADDDARGPSGVHAREAGQVQRVILIVVDTLRRDVLSCYSDDAPPTPNLDRLAADSVLFEDARASAPWTLPSMCSILTGLSPEVHLAVAPTAVLPDEVPTLAERMRAAGYRTSALGENAFLQERSRLDRGFDSYRIFPHLTPAPLLGGKLMEAAFPEATQDYLPAVDLTRFASTWLEENRDEDFFLWLHYFDPHLSYEPHGDFRPEGEAPPGMGHHFRGLHDVRLGHFVPDARERSWIRALYEGEVRFLDHHLGRLIAHLKELDLYDDTLIVLTSDHGEEFWDHEGFEHGHTVYEELLGVPLIVKLPGSALVERVAEPVSVESIVPTVLELCGVDYDPAAFSAPPLIRDLQAPHVDAAQRPLLSTGQLYYENHTALRVGPWKYIVRHDNGSEELYDLGLDPAELADRAGELTEELERARAALLAEQARAEELRSSYGVEETATRELDETTAGELRKLGYVR